MNNDYRNKTTPFIVFFIILSIIATITILNLSGCVNPQTKFEKRITYTIVDSTWSKKSGEINTLQIDPIYYCKTHDNNIISGRIKFSVGDTIKRIKYFHSK